VRARSLFRSTAVKKVSGFAMDDRLSPDPTVASSGRVLTFAITSGLPDVHPGIVHLEERLPGGSYRSLHHRFICLYQPEVASDLGQVIAGAIYDDLLIPRHGREKGPRFDFQSACEIHLIQRTGVDAGKPSRGGNARYTTAPIGITPLPGGLSRGEICAAIARTFHSGWQRLADEAYVHPSQVASGTGSVVYDYLGWRFTRVARFESNFRQITGPVVFFACQDEHITEFATLHQGHGKDGSIVNYYRLYGFFYTPTGIWLIEKGAFPLSVPIRIPRYHPWDDIQRREEGDTLGDWEVFSDQLVSFWHLSAEGIRVIGGVPPGTDYPIRECLDELYQQLRTMHTNSSIYCSSCGRDYRPDISVRELEVFSSRGDLLDVCSHSFYCSRCHRWSTPIERDQAFTWNERCEHTKSSGAHSAFGHYIPDRDLSLTEHSSTHVTPRSAQVMVRSRAMVRRGQLGSVIAPLTSTRAVSGSSISTQASIVNESEEQIARMQLFASLAEHLRLSRDQATKSLDIFWKQVERTPAGCWLWRGEQSKTTLYHGSSLHSSTRRTEASKLAWMLGTGQLLPVHSRLLSTCETPGCMNPAHKIEFVWLSDVFQWLCPGDQVGEDDWQEVAYHFKQRVTEGSVPSLRQREGDIAVRRAEFDAWLGQEGSQLMSEFSYKYRVARATAASRAKDSRQSKRRAERTIGQDEVWWKRFGFSKGQAEKQVSLFQEMTKLENDGAYLDQSTAQRNLERFYSRIDISQGECWRWAWQEPQFRLHKYGPWVGPRELAWWLSTGTRYRGLGVHIASHNGRSWCINPAHSDVEFTTVSAALFLIQKATLNLTALQDSPHPLDEPVQELRHFIHQAIEHRKLPYRLDKGTLGLKLWRSDVLSWWEAQRQESGDRSALHSKEKERR